jgi:alcohol dehydrogenase class IV
MPISTFSFPTTIIFGPGAVERLAAELEKKGARNPLLVADRGLVGTAVLARVHSLIPHAALFTDVDPNPIEQNVSDGVDFYRANGCDSIVGLGGGSPIDAAKAIRLKVTHSLPLADYDDLIDGWQKITADLPPFVAIPTTAGTGSEVGRSTVITLAATNRKTVIFSPHLIPSPAIVDPELTTSLPPHITAGTGMDALTHNVEAYLSRGYHPLCDAIAFAGAKLANENLPVVMTDPANLEARGNMLMASMMGAIAFQKGLGATHSLAHPLSSECGLHHGTANAILLPWVLEFNRPAAQQSLNTLEAHLDCPDLANRVRELNEICRIKPRLRDYHVPRETLPALAAKAIQDGCHQLNPRTVTAEDLLGLYEQAY